MTTGQRLCDGGELLFNGAEARQLILRLDQVIDHVADVFFDEPYRIEIGARCNAGKQATEALELIKPFADLMKSAIRLDFLPAIARYPAQFPQTALQTRPGQTTACDPDDGAANAACEVSAHFRP